MVVAVIILVFLNLTFRRIYEYRTLAMAMFMIAPFPWQISGIRAALACSILMYALSLYAIDPKKNSWKFCVFLFAATLVHYSSILFVFMLLAQKKTTRFRVALFMTIAVLGTLVVENSDILLKFVSMFTTRDKIINWLSGGAGKEGYPNWKGFIAELLVLFGNLFLTMKSKALIVRHDLEGKRAKFASTVYDINVIMLLFIPLLRLNDMYVRILLVVYGVDIVVYAMAAFLLQESKLTKKEDIKWVYKPKTKMNIFALTVPLWTYAIAFYQNYPFFGTTESVIRFLDKIYMFR